MANYYKLRLFFVKFLIKSYLPIIFVLLFTNVSLAGFVIFEKEYSYQASELDSKVSCRVIAMEQVKRLLLEELGTYLESKTEVKNFQLTKDQITTLTAGIIRAEVIDEKWDGKVYYLKAKISADPDEVAKSVDVLRKDEQKTETLYNLAKEVARLKKELETAKVGGTKTDAKKIEEYNAAVEGLNANKLV